MDGQSFGQSQWNFLLTSVKLNHAQFDWEFSIVGKKHAPERELKRAIYKISLRQGG